MSLDGPKAARTAGEGESNVVGLSAAVERCEQTGLDCDGPRDTAFIDGTIVRSRRTARPAGDVVASSSSNPSIPPAPSLRPMETELSLAHVRKWLAKDGPVDLAMQQMSLGEVGADDARLSHQLILSFAFIVFGSQQRLDSTATKGYRLYGQSLAQLNKALSDPECYTRDEVCLSVITLACLELLAPSSPGVGLKHVLGLERLLELRGPRVYCLKHPDIFNCTAIMILDASLRMGHPSVLAREDWKAQSRARCTDAQLQEQDLLDMLADCTLLGAERARLLTRQGLDPVTHAAELENIERQGSTLSSRLLEWKVQWDSIPANQLTVEEPMQGHRGLPSLGFSGGSAATMYVVYHTVLIRHLMSMTTHEVPGRPGRPSDQDASLQIVSTSAPDHSASGEDRAGQRRAALEICRCVPYLLRQAGSIQCGRSTAFVWAVMTAWDIVCGSAEGIWLLNALRTGGGEATASMLEAR
ncbi:hypothetical protein LTR53_001684 [Teratosphaeriaceae sp. CCFEE 6253]|nr:hypothetical protein LTR53_001684 [Teratosphaeriaceae sp. CCFEE 6253]